MSRTRKISAAGFALALACCQSLDGARPGIGGRAPLKEAQGEGFCERQLLVCVAGETLGLILGLILIGDLIAAEN